MDLHGPTPRIWRTQRIALALLVLSGAVNSIDRATLAVANLLRQWFTPFVSHSG